MEIAKIIQESRRKKGYTQERLAELVGVSAPAVSKWETGASLPDITLLAPVARALGITVDQLLDFRASPDAQEVNALEQACAETFGKEGYAAGKARCEALLCEYPNCAYLRFRIAGLYQRFLVELPGASDERIREELARIRELMRQVYDSGDSGLHAAAAVSLASHALMEDDLERAEALLSELPRTEIDPDELYPLLYWKLGEPERAAKLLEERAYRTGGEAVRALNLLSTIASQAEEHGRALAYSRASAALVQTLDLRDVTGCTQLLALLNRSGEAEEAVEAAAGYLRRLAALGEERPHPLFERLELRQQPESLRAVQRLLLAGFEADESYAALRQDAGVKAAMEALRGKISQNPG